MHGRETPPLRPYGRSWKSPPGSPGLSPAAAAPAGVGSPSTHSRPAATATRSPDDDGALLMAAFGMDHRRPGNLGIPASTAYRRVYLQRARGVLRTFTAEQYWD